MIAHYPSEWPLIISGRDTSSPSDLDVGAVVNTD